MNIKITKDKSLVVLNLDDITPLSTGTYVPIPNSSVEIRVDTELRSLLREVVNLKRAAKNKEDTPLIPCSKCGGERVKYTNKEPNYSVVKCLDCKHKVTGKISEGKDPVTIWNSQQPYVSIAEDRSYELFIKEEL